MKEIHDASFNFLPMNCGPLLLEILATPVPQHLLAQNGAEEGDDGPPHGGPAPLITPSKGDLSKLPLPMSSLLGANARARLTAKGKSILCAIQAPEPDKGPRGLTRRETILWALTDNAYA